MTGDEFDLTDLIDVSAAAQGSPAQGKPGGHHYWCAECGGFRTHSAELRQDEKLYLKCRECEHETTLVFVGGVWTNEAISASLRGFLGVRSERLLREFDSALVAEIAKPDEVPKPGVVEATKGAAAKRLGILGKVAHEDVDRALDAMRRRIDVRGFSDSAIDSALGPAEMVPLVDHENIDFPGRRATPQPRTRWKVAVGLVSAPFLLMGALYLLAFNGIYVWPIYYALQPYWRSWMNEPYFYGLSVLVPALAVVAYYISKRGRGRESDGHATPPRGSLGAKAPAAMREASPAAAKTAAPAKKKERPEWW